MNCGVAYNTIAKSHSRQRPPVVLNLYPSPFSKAGHDHSNPMTSVYSWRCERFKGISNTEAGMISLPFHQAAILWASNVSCFLICTSWWKGQVRILQNFCSEIGGWAPVASQWGGEINKLLAQAWLWPPDTLILSCLWHAQFALYCPG